MSLDWKLQGRLANRSHNLAFFLAMSLLLHGAVFWGLAIYWRSTSLRTPEAPLPVEFIQLPADKAAVKPPLNTKRRASSNSRAGRTRLELPLATGALEVRPKSSSLVSQPNLPRSKASTQPTWPVQPPQPTSPSSPLPLVTNTSKVRANPASQPEITQLKAPIPQPPAVHSPQLSQPTPLPSPLPLTKETSAESKIPLPVSQPNTTRSKAPSPQSSQPARPPQPALLSSLLSLATGVFETTKTPVNQPNSTHPRLPTPPLSQIHSPQTVPPSSPALMTGPSKISSQARLPASQQNINRSQPTTPQFSRLHSLQPTRIATSALTGNKWNTMSPIAPAPSKPKSSPRLSQGQANLLGGTIAMNTHDFMSNRDHLPNSDRPSADSNGVDARRDSDMGPYLDRLRQQVADQWPHQEANSSKQTIVVFSISRTGALINLGILQPSGSMSVDAAALGAVQRAAPFEPLPESFPTDHYTIRFKFTINVSGQLDLH